MNVLLLEISNAIIGYCPLSHCASCERHSIQSRSKASFLSSVTQRWNKRDICIFQ